MFCVGLENHEKPLNEIIELLEKNNIQFIIENNKNKKTLALSLVTNTNPVDERTFSAFWQCAVILTNHQWTEVKNNRNNKNLTTILLIFQHYNKELDVEFNIPSFLEKIEAVASARN